MKGTEGRKEMISERMYYFFYRPIMRIAHRFNWHYAPEIGPLEDGRTQLWCQWCGFRMSKSPNFNPINEEALRPRKPQVLNISNMGEWPDERKPS